MNNLQSYKYATQFLCEVPWPTDEIAPFVKIIAYSCCTHLEGQVTGPHGFCFLLKYFKNISKMCLPSPTAGHSHCFYVWFWAVASFYWFHCYIWLTGWTLPWWRLASPTPEASTRPSRPHRGDHVTVATLESRASVDNVLQVNINTRWILVSTDCFKVWITSANMPNELSVHSRSEFFLKQTVLWKLKY